VPLARCQEGFALLPLNSFALLAFDSDGADSVCADAIVAETTSMLATAMHRTDTGPLTIQ